MYLLSKDGSRHLMEFLRNLTPQVLLLSSALVIFVLWRKHPATYWYLILFIGVSVMCIVAALANSGNFLDNAVSHAAAIAEERDRLKAESVNGFARLRRILAYIWREERGAFLEAVIAILFIYIALVVILVASVTSAIRALG